METGAHCLLHKPCSRCGQIKYYLQYPTKGAHRSRNGARKNICRACSRKQGRRAQTGSEALTNSHAAPSDAVGTDIAGEAFDIVVHGGDTEVKVRAVSRMEEPGDSSQPAPLAPVESAHQGDAEHACTENPSSGGEGDGGQAAPAAVKRKRSRRRKKPADSGLPQKEAPGMGSKPIRTAEAMDLAAGQPSAVIAAGVRKPPVTEYRKVIWPDPKPVIWPDPKPEKQAAPIVRAPEDRSPLGQTESDEGQDASEAFESAVIISGGVRPAAVAEETAAPAGPAPTGSDEPLGGAERLGDHPAADWTEQADTTAEPVREQAGGAGTPDTAAAGEEAAAPRRKRRRRRKKSAAEQEGAGAGEELALEAVQGLEAGIPDAEERGRGERSRIGAFVETDDALEGPLEASGEAAEEAHEANEDNEASLQIKRKKKRRRKKKTADGRIGEAFPGVEAQETGTGGLPGVPEAGMTEGASVSSEGCTPEELAPPLSEDGGEEGDSPVRKGRRKTRRSRRKPRALRMDGAEESFLEMPAGEHGVPQAWEAGESVPSWTDDPEDEEDESLPAEADESSDASPGQDSDGEPVRRKRRKRRKKKRSGIDEAAGERVLTRPTVPKPASRIYHLDPDFVQNPTRKPGAARMLRQDREGLIRMKGVTKNGKRWIQDVDWSLAVLLVEERAAVVLTPYMIRRLYSNDDFRLMILQRDNYTCVYCGEYGDTIDHIVPRAKGGHTTPVNCVCSCYLCNQSKADQDAERFIMRSRDRHGALEGIAPDAGRMTDSDGTAQE